MKRVGLFRLVTGVIVPLEACLGSIQEICMYYSGKHGPRADSFLSTKYVLKIADKSV